MPKKLPIDYDDEPPVWLSCWPSEGQLKAWFTSGVRKMAYRVLGRKREPELRWTTDRLLGVVGDQQATWRLSREQWAPSCSCGYPGGKCPHTYALACMFEQVCRQEGWVKSGPDRTQPAQAGSRPESSRAGAPSTAPAAAAHQESGQPRITAEVDFLHASGKAILRFYLDTDVDRRLLRLQSVYNYAIQLSRKSSQNRWQDGDRQFLKWLAPQIRDRIEVRQNLQVLKLTRDQFDSWLEYWEGSLGRFIERSSQQQLTAVGTQPSHLVIELKDLGEKVQIGAVVVTPNGKRYFLHEVLQLLGQGGDDAILGGEIVRFDPPFSAELLRDVFAEKPRTTNRENVCTHLPALIENRLDIVEGTGVIRNELEQGQISLQAKVSGAQIVVVARIGNIPICPSRRVTAGNLRDQNGKFVIDVYHLPLVEELRRDLRALQGQESADFALHVPGDPKAVARLLKLWRRLPEDVQRSISPELEALLGSQPALEPELRIHEDGRFVDFQLQWQCGDIPVSAAEVRDAVRAGSAVLRTAQGRWLALDPEAAKAALARLEQSGFAAGSHEHVFKHVAGERIASLRQDCGVGVAASSRSLAERIQQQPTELELCIPKQLEKILRPYQKTGFQFLVERAAYGVGAILADDMGLGKTLQALALVQALAKPNSITRGGDFRALVVCPSSVIGVWLDEARRFCPSLLCRSYRGGRDERENIFTGPWQVLIVNYAMLRADADIFLGCDYNLVVIDEAQQIKNPDAQISRVTKQLRTSLALALTGTPLENRLLDLWSIMDFVNPGFLGSKEAFLQLEGEAAQRSHLIRQVSPVILRRTKEAVAPELPPRSEEVLTLELTDLQRDLYTRELVRARDAVRQKGPVEILAALTRLRQICCHPSLVSHGAEAADSAKLTALSEMLVELADEGHSALVFSQFTSMLDLIRPVLESQGLTTMTITGETPVEKRPELVRQFNAASESVVFLLSLRAAGTGLNLTKAGYVFLFDPWWNPAVERQAIDRTHRIGQQKPVFAYRLVAANTVEEKVLELQREKAELFAEVMGESEQRGSALPRFTAADLSKLLD